MSRFLSKALTMGIPFGILMSVFSVFMFPWKTAIGMGAGSGVLFGLGMAVVVTVTSSRMRNASLPAGESLLKDGPANLMRGIQGVGGWLTLSPNALYFRPHKLNVQAQELILPLASVTGAQATRTLGVIPNGLLVSSHGREADRFIVEGSNEWVDAILQARAAVAAR